MNDFFEIHDKDFTSDVKMSCFSNPRDTELQFCVSCLMVLFLFFFDITIETLSP